MLEVLNYTKWNRKKAADVLRVSYKSLLNKINQYKLEERGRSWNGCIDRI